MSKMLRTLAIGSGALALIPTVQAATPTPASPEKPPPMSASSLPIYEAPHAEYGEYVESKTKNKKPGIIRESLVGPVTAVRQQTQVVWDQATMVADTIYHTYHDALDKTEWLQAYLREEEHKQQRYGAVAMGGLAGYVLGLRGGIFRRLVYCGAGTAALGFVCFPEETRALARDGGARARQYVNIAYNFLYGVKPGDPQLEVQFPELSIPKDFSEFGRQAASVVSSLALAVMPPPAKEAVDSKPSDKKD